MRKVLLFFVILSLSLGLFACAKPGFSDFEEEGDLNFMGGKFVILQEWYTKFLQPKRGDNASDDRMLDRFLELENKYNLVFDYPLVENIPAYLLGKSIAGNLHVDLMEIGNQSLYELYKLNMVLPVGDVIPDIDEDKWGSASVGEKTVFYGTRYGFFANKWDSGPDIGDWLICNLDNFDKYGVTNPHEYLENGEWDWEHLKIMLRQATVNDGDNKFVGLLYDGIYMGTSIVIPAILSNGGYFLRQSGGKYEIGLKNPEAIEAIEFTVELMTEGIAEVGPGGLAGDIWNEGRRWMVAYGGGAPTSRDWNLTAIRYATGPNGDPNAITAFMSGRGRFWGFPIFSIYGEEDLYAVVDDLFEPLEPNYYPNGWKDYLQDVANFECDDYEYYLRATDEAFVYNTVVLEQSSGAVEEALQTIYRQGVSINVALDSIIDLFTADVDEHYNR